MTTFHEFSMAALSGEEVALSDFAGSACLVVNVASA